MTGFSTDWLRLREPFDLLARRAALHALDLTQAVSEAQTGRPGGSVLRVTDLACGTGANLRALAPHLGGEQQWQLVDHDPALLAAVPQALHEWALRDGHHLQMQGDVLLVEGGTFSAEVHRRTADLVRDLARVDLFSTDLVTASALLDLVSTDWLDRLLQHLESSTASLLFALNVDGRHDWTPPDADDDAVQALFAQHQRGDKGFGPALGPDAALQAAQRFRAAGYQVRQARSDWLIEPGAAPPQAQPLTLLEQMLDGIADAAIEHDPSARPRVDTWRIRRFACLGDTRLQVGHVDLLCTRGDMLMV